MDETLATQRAREHGEAVVAGDLRRAAGDLHPAAREQAADVMRRLPQPLTAAEVIGAEPSGAGQVVLIAYRGQTGETVVASTWEERDGEVSIVELEIRPGRSGGA